MRQNECKHRFGHTKIAKIPVFYTRQPDSRRGLLRTRKNRQKPPVFNVFWRFCSFFLSRKNGHMRQNKSRAQSSGHFWDPQKRKKTQFLTLDPRFPSEGCIRPKKIAKNHQFLTLDSRIPAEGCSKIQKTQKSQKPLSF